MSRVPYAHRHPGTAMTSASLHSYTAKDLGQMARQAGVSGWHGMRKAELVDALVGSKHPLPQKNGTNGAALNGASLNGARSGIVETDKRPSAPRISAKKRRIQKKLAELNKRRQQLHDLSTACSEAKNGQADRLVILVRDPYWLHICWELSPQGIGRARTALGQYWHGAVPVLRIHRLLEDGATESVRQVAIHGGVSNWYVDVEEPPSRYRAEIGYATQDMNGSNGNESGVKGDFYCIARSNAVLTPAPGAPDAVDNNWSDVALNADRVYAMSGGYSHDGVSLELQELLEQRLRCRLGRPSETRFGNGASQPMTEQLHFAVDAELVVYGSADPNSHVTIKGEPVALQPDGSFAVKMPLPDRRQVIPLVANSPNGVDQKTIILGVDRNTKQLEQRRRDPLTGR